MAELLITQTELDQYLSGLDLTDTVNNRVFNAIQLLTPTLYNDVLYYLVIGKITVSQLDASAINNASVQVLIESLSQSDESTLARQRVYRTFQNTLPAFRAFIAKMNVTSPQFFFRTVRPNSTFMTVISLDRTGLDATKFTSLFDAKIRYNNIIVNSQKLPEYAALVAFAQTHGYSKLVELMQAELNVFKLLSITDTTLQNQISYNDSIVGYILRGVYTDPFRVNFIENLDYAVNRMVDKFDLDEPKDGILGVKAAWETDTWASVFSAPTSREMIEKLGKTSYIRYVLPYVYGSLYFTAEEIARESLEHSTIVSGDPSASGLLDLAYTYLLKTAVLLRTGMSPVVVL